MNLLLEIYKKLTLKESVSTASVSDSIEGRYQVTINYEGDPAHGIAPGLRTIQTYVYGLTKAGNPVIRAYQPYGDTASNVPSWKFFRLDRIKSWKPTYALVTTPAPGFNPNGDKSMSVVYSIANFNTPPEETQVGAKQKYKEVGKLDNFDKIMVDRDREKNRRTQSKVSQKNTSARPTVTEPKIELPPQTKPQEIPEPKVDNVKQEPIDQPQISTPDNKEVYKTKGEEELDKVKDLNRRLDQARKIDLNNIPRR